MISKSLVGWGGGIWRLAQKFNGDPTDFSIQDAPCLSDCGVPHGNFLIPISLSIDELMIFLSSSGCLLNTDVER